MPHEFSKELNLNLSHNLYGNKSQEVMNLEREALHIQSRGAAIKLLNNFCGKPFNYKYFIEKLKNFPTEFERNIKGCLLEKDYKLVYAKLSWAKEFQLAI